MGIHVSRKVTRITVDCSLKTGDGLVVIPLEEGNKLKTVSVRITTHGAVQGEVLVTREDALKLAESLRELFS